MERAESGEKIKCGLHLREYQEECVKEAASLKNGSVLVSLATGLGKTVVMAGIYETVRKKRKNARLLILSHRDELVRQPEQYFHDPFGIEKAGTHSDGEPVVSASVQTLFRDARLSGFAPDAFDMIFVDEAHHAAAPTYKKILKYFNARLVIGFTATAKRGDNVRLDDVFDRILFSRDIQWGITNRWLCPIRAVCIPTDANFSGINLLAGDFVEKDMSERIIKSDMVFRAASAYIQYCRAQDRKTLAYAPDVNLCYALATAIQELLPEDEQGSVKVVTGKTPKEERQETLDAYKGGDVACIVNCMVLTEGFDAPETSAVLVMRPTCNDSLYQQIIGRGLRLSGSGKKDCLILDVMPKEGTDGHRICTALSLFGEDPKFLPASRRKQMEKEYDLMEMIESVRRATDLFRDEISNMNLFKEEFNIFGEMRTKEILSGTETHIPNEFSKFQVHVMPSSTGRYEIDFSRLRVSVSEPDVMGMAKVMITEGSATYAKQAKIEEIAEILQVLSNADSGPAFYWSRDVHNEWEHMEATPAQISALKSSSLSLPDSFHCSKAKASELIDLDRRMKALRCDLRKRGILYKEARTAAKQEEQEKAALAAFAEYRNETEEARTENAEAFDRYMSGKKRIADSNRKYREAEEKANAKWSTPGTFTLRISKSSEYKTSAAKKPSIRQIEFIDSLTKRLAAKGVYFKDGDWYSPCSEREASAAITCLLELDKQVPYMSKRSKKAGNIYIGPESYKKAIKSALDSSINAELFIQVGDHTKN